jgi:tetratricopeptide (TPR) repeat protein
MVFLRQVMSYFARMFLAAAVRITVAAACCLGIWFSWRAERADRLSREDTIDSLRAAIKLVPDGWQYYMRLAQLDRAHSHELLETALKLNRYNAQAAIELALRDESEGDYGAAEKLLLGAFAVDQTYLPRWSLANFYFRRDNMTAFWMWARRAADMPTEDMGPLFELCWHVTPDAEAVAKAVLTDDRGLVRQYLSFLMDKGQMDALARVAPRLARVGNPETDRAFLLGSVNRLVTANDAAGASAVWKSMVEQHWIAADPTLPNNGDFNREPLPVAFDWTLPEYSGLHSWPGSSGLETELTGEEPENCVIAEQYLTLAPGKYTLSYSYHTIGIAPGTGIRWQILDSKTGNVVAESEALSSDAQTRTNWTFAIPDGVSLQRLRLAYQRALGTPRISGTLLVLSTRIQAATER